VLLYSITLQALEYKQMENGILWHFLLEKDLKVKNTKYGGARKCKKNGVPVLPASSRFRRPCEVDVPVFLHI